MNPTDRVLLSGNEAVALAALHEKVNLGTGYPGTPSTEILENLAKSGGPAGVKTQWAPNEKVAFEVAVGAVMTGASALVTMKHVGLNVAADPLFTAAYIELPGALLIVSADDPGMASSQNEQDNRRYAVAAGVPMFEPADSQEAYDFTRAALALSRKHHCPVLLRMTTRVCHSKTLVQPGQPVDAPIEPKFQRAISERVMLPGYARPAHRRLRKKLDTIQAMNEGSEFHKTTRGEGKLGIVTSGISYHHVREADPEADVLKLGLSYPLPIETIRRFAESVGRCLVIEEGDPYLVEQLRSEGIDVEGKPAMYRFGELSVSRVRRILENDLSEEPVPPKGKPPALCIGCPHRIVFEILSEMDCIVSGDIGCYTLGVMPPFEAMDMLVCMGASVGMGLGARHVLSEDQARRVVSVIGDSTFVHSGITGLVEMAYNRPKTGHVVMILDNSTTAMTGLQEHPGTGRKLNYEPTHKLDLEGIARACGIDQVHTVEPKKERERLEQLLRDGLASDELTVLIVRRPCILAMAKQKAMEKKEA